MRQEQLFFENTEEALRDLIHALGGFKVVGHQLKPHLSPEAAGRWLADTLNDQRNDVLSWQQFQLLLQMGRHAGVHTAATQLMRDAGYADPQPIEPEDERDQLRKDTIRAAEILQRVGARLEALEHRTAPGKVRSIG